MSDRQDPGEQSKGPGASPPSPTFLAVFPSVMLPMFLALIDQTIVATALPAIAGALGGVERVSWIVIAYLIAATITAPVYGRLGDLLGRQRIMFVALAIFIAASILCALSTSMMMLAIGRVLQGLGGGGLMTLSQALVGETVPPRDRARYQGYLAAIGVTSNTFGPVVGGFLTEHFGWRSIFLVNIPVGIAAALLMLRLPRRPGSGEPFRFDYAGLALFASFIVSVLLMLEQAQRLQAGHTLLMLGLLVIAVVSVALLIAAERRVRAPLLPIALLSHPAIWRSDALAACHGAIIIALLTFVPIYLRVVHGTSAGETGPPAPPDDGRHRRRLAHHRPHRQQDRADDHPPLGRPRRRHLRPDAAGAPVAAPQRHRAVVAARLQRPLHGDGHERRAGDRAGIGRAEPCSAPPPLRCSSRARSAPRSGTALVAAVLFATLSLTDGEAAGLLGVVLQQGPDALSALTPSRHAVVQGEFSQAFRAAFLTTAGFAAVACLLTWTIPLRRI